MNMRERILSGKLFADMCEGTYVNFNCNFADDGLITAGKNVMFGPAVTIATVGHPIRPDLRGIISPVQTDNSEFIILPNQASTDRINVEAEHLSRSAVRSFLLPICSQKTQNCIS